MLQPRITRHLARTAFKPSPICSRCDLLALHRPQFLPTRTFASSTALRTSPSTPPQPSTPSSPPNPPQPPPPEKDEDFVPKPIGRPIGFSAPPRAGENTGLAPKKKDYSGMTLSERNLAKRADLVEKWSTNYFRDFKNIRKYREGKTFVANPRIFKKEVAMYFPNLHGDTLEEGAKGKGRDTTDVLMGKVSIVRLYSSTWGEAQVESFTGRRENPELWEVLNEEGDLAQLVDVNVEENVLKAGIIAMFSWKQRMTKKREEWGRYFVVKRGVDQRIREAIGALNGRVGYVYLVDADCKIRWAGSANAEGTEKEDMVRGLRRCLEEVKNPRSGLRR